MPSTLLQSPLHIVARCDPAADQTFRILADRSGSSGASTLLVYASLRVTHQIMLFGKLWIGENVVEHLSAASEAMCEDNRWVRWFSYSVGIDPRAISRDKMSPITVLWWLQVHKEGRCVAENESKNERECG